MAVRADKLLLETGDELLLETGDTLLLESEQTVLNSVIFQGPLWLGADQASQKIPVTLVGTDNELATGITAPTIELSKNGGAYAAASDGTWAEVSDGDYTITLDKTDTGTVGWLNIRVVKAGLVEAKVLCHVCVDPEDMRTSYMRLRTLHRTGK